MLLQHSTLCPNRTKCEREWLGQCWYFVSATSQPCNQRDFVLRHPQLCVYVGCNELVHVQRWRLFPGYLIVYVAWGKPGRIGMQSWCVAYVCVYVCGVPRTQENNAVLWSFRSSSNWLMKIQGSERRDSTHKAHGHDTKFIIYSLVLFTTSDLFFQLKTDTFSVWTGFCCDWHPRTTQV